MFQPRGILADESNPSRTKKEKIVRENASIVLNDNHAAVMEVQ